jgi:hypothetical protein
MVFHEEEGRRRRKGGKKARKKERLWANLEHVQEACFF